MDLVQRMASQNAVVIFSRSSCCMCLVVKKLFRDLGVNAVVFELDKDPKERELDWALARLLGNKQAVPAVFIGGRLVGTTENVNALHIQGNLVPMLKAVGALWL